jgi:iron complex outermembrane receptor protein
MRCLPIVAVAAAVLCAGARAAELPVVRGEEVVVTATRFLERYVDRPVNVTVIGAEEIRASTAKTVPELLAAEPGFAIHDFFGNNAATTTVDLRGFGITGAQNTLVLLDGRRIGDIDLSGIQWSAIPLAAIERIEIVRGSGAVLYGEGATAGVVNIVTRSPAAIGNFASLQGLAGSYGTASGQLYANHFSGPLGLNVVAANYGSSGYRANNANRQSNAQAELRWLAGRGELSLRLADDNQGIRLPGARIVQPSAGVNELATDRRGTSTPLDYAQREGGRFALDWRYQAGFGELVVAAGYRDKRQSSYFDFGGFPDYRVADLDVWSFSPRVRVPHRILGAQATLIAGFDAYRWDYRLRRSNSAANIGRPINTVQAEQRTEAVYLHHTTRAGPHWTLTAGARAERLRLSARDLFDPSAPGGAFGSGAAPGAQLEHEHAYEIGLRHELAPGLALIALAGRSYRFANVDEIYETSPAFANEFQFLRPQRAHSRELSLEARPGRARLRATLFEIRVADEIRLDPFSTGIGNTNLPPSRRRGLELEARAALAPALQVRAAYTYADARFLEGVLPGSPFTQQNVAIAGRRVPLVPRRSASAGFSWKLGGSTRLDGRLAYVGRQFMDNDEGNTLGTTIPAYALADLKLEHESGGWRIAFAVNNLLDERYYNYAVRSQFVPDRYAAYPLPGRSITVTAEYALR